MRRQSVGSKQWQRSGTAAVEFAVCVPLLLLLALACSDFGRIVYFHQIVVNAARTAAESGATHGFTAYTQPSWEADVYQAALEEMQNVPQFDEGELDYDLTTTTDADGLARITVNISYPFRTVVTWPGLPSEVVLHRIVQFRQFR